MEVRHFKLSYSDLVFIAVLVLALASGQKMMGIDSDLGRHLALGNYILDERVIPTFDLFSHTRAGLSRPPYEWLSQVLFAITYRVLSLDGVILFTSFIIALTFQLIYHFSSRGSGSPLLASIITFVSAGASSIHWLPRPHIFTFLFLAIWIELLGRLARGEPLRLYIFPAIMLIWSNLHGGFVFGILAWIAYFAGWGWDKWRNKSEYQTGTKMLIVGGSSLIATVITPDFWRNWEAVLNNRSAFILNRTVETMRPNLVDPTVLPYTLLLSLTILLFAINWKSLMTGHIFLLGGLGIASLLMARNIPLFVIASVPILSRMGGKMLTNGGAWTRVEKRFGGFGSTSLVRVWPTTALLLAIATFAIFNQKNGQSAYLFDSAVFPVDAVKFLQENPEKGKMFNEFNWGGYLLHSLGASNPVFLDSQSDFYGETLLREYDQIINANVDWEKLLEKYQVDWVIIPEGSSLAEVISVDPHWKLIYKDNLSLIGIRK